MTSCSTGIAGLNSQYTVFLAGAVAHLLLAGCSSASEGVVLVNDHNDSADFEQYEDSVQRLPDGGYVVEGDIGIPNIEKLRQFWEADRQASPNALTVSLVEKNRVLVENIWAFPTNMRLQYCVGDSFSTRERMAIKAALKVASGWWSSLAAVKFEEVEATRCDVTSPVVFDVQKTNSRSYDAKSFLPSYERADRRLLVGPSAFEPIKHGVTLEGLMAHELGHALGFRHEHIWTGKCMNESSDNARLVTEYDQLSVMMYPECRKPEGGGLALTDRDHLGAVKVYGLAPALISAAAL